MDEFLAVCTSFPTVVPTVLLGVAILYWLLVVSGALGIDALGGGELESAAKGAGEALEGAAKGAGEALEGAAKGAGEALEGAAKGAGEATLGVAKATSDGAISLSSLLRAKNVPITLWLSAVVLFAWVLCALGTHYVPLSLPPAIAAITTLLAAFALAVPIAGITTRPLGPVFTTTTGRQNQTLVGIVVRIDTGRVDRRFGQARVDSEGAELVLQVRADPEVALTRGDDALIVAYDAERDEYEVEAMKRVMRDR